MGLVSFLVCCYGKNDAGFARPASDQWTALQEIRNQIMWRFRHIGAMPEQASELRLQFEIVGCPGILDGIDESVVFTAVASGGSAAVFVFALGSRQILHAKREGAGEPVELERERDDQIQRLKFENEMLQDQLHSKRKPARHKPKAAPKITGKFGTFEFDYIDAEGNFSHRVVDANAIEEERFSGYCHEAGAIRTFRFENVMGDLVNTETGEMLDAELWADGVRRNHAIY